MITARFANLALATMSILANSCSRLDESCEERIVRESLREGSAEIFYVDSVSSAAAYYSDFCPGRALIVSHRRSSEISSQLEKLSLFKESGIAELHANNISIRNGELVFSGSLKIKAITKASIPDWLQAYSNYNVILNENDST